MSLVKYNKAKSVIEDIHSKFNIEVLKNQHDAFCRIKRRKNRTDRMNNEMLAYNEGYKIYKKYIRAEKTMTKNVPSNDSVTSEHRRPFRDITNFDINNLVHGQHQVSRVDKSSVINGNIMETPNGTSSNINRDENSDYYDNALGSIAQDQQPSSIVLCQFINEDEEENEADNTSEEVMNNSQEDEEHDASEVILNNTRHCQNCKRHSQETDDRFRININVCERKKLIKQK